MTLGQFFGYHSEYNLTFRHVIEYFKRPVSFTVSIQAYLQVLVFFLLFTSVFRYPKEKTYFLLSTEACFQVTISYTSVRTFVQVKIKPSPFLVTSLLWGTLMNIFVFIHNFFLWFPSTWIFLFKSVLRYPDELVFIIMHPLPDLC